MIFKIISYGIKSKINFNREKRKFSLKLKQMLQKECMKSFKPGKKATNWYMNKGKMKINLLMKTRKMNRMRKNILKHNCWILITTLTARRCSLTFTVKMLELWNGLVIKTVLLRRKSRLWSSIKKKSRKMIVIIEELFLKIFKDQFNLIIFNPRDLFYIFAIIVLNY